MDRTQAALDRMATEDPELAARLFVQMLPAVAQRLSGPLAYDLTIEDLGTWHVAVDANGRLYAATSRAVRPSGVSMPHRPPTLETVFAPVPQIPGNTDCRCWDPQATMSMKSLAARSTGSPWPWH